MSNSSAGNLSAFVYCCSYLGHVIRRISPRALWIYSTHLPLVVINELHGVSFQIVKSGSLGERRHIMMYILACNVGVETLVHVARATRAHVYAHSFNPP